MRTEDKKRNQIKGGEVTRGKRRKKEKRRKRRRKNIMSITLSLVNECCGIQAKFQ